MVYGASNYRIGCSGCSTVIGRRRRRGRTAQIYRDTRRSVDTDHPRSPLQLNAHAHTGHSAEVSELGHVLYSGQCSLDYYLRKPSGMESRTRSRKAQRSKASIPLTP